MSVQNTGPIDTLTAALLSQASYTPLATFQAQGNSALPTSLSQPDSNGNYWKVDTGNSYGVGVNQFITFVQYNSSGDPINVVMTFKGSSPSQLLSDVTPSDQGASDYEVLQAEANMVLQNIYAEYPGANVVTDGHSLGGGMAQTFALENGLSGYGQNSLPISPTYYDDLGGQAAVDDWKNAGNFWAETNTDGDIATNAYYGPFAIFSGGGYLNTVTQTIPTGWQAASVAMGGGILAGGAITGTGGLVGLGGALVLVDGGSAHVLDTVIPAIQAAEQNSDTGDNSTVTADEASSGGDADLAAETDPTQTIVDNGNGSVTTDINGSEVTVSDGTVSGNIDSETITGIDPTPITAAAVISGSGEDYNATSDDDNILEDLVGDNELDTGNDPAILIGSSGDTLSVEANNSTAITTGNDDTVQAAGDDETVAVTGTDNQISLSSTGDTIGLGDNAQATISGNDENEILDNYAQATVTNGTQQNVTIAGIDVSIYSTDELLQILYNDPNAPLDPEAGTINGSGDTIDYMGPDSGSSLAIDGGDDTIDESGDSDTTTNINNASDPPDTVNLGNNAGDTANFGANSSGTVTGTGDSVGIGGSNVSITASGDTVDTTSGGSGTVSGNNDTLIDTSNTVITLTGSGENVEVTGSNDTLHLGAGDAVTVENGGSAAVYGNSLTVNADSNASVTMESGDSSDTVNVDGTNDSVTDSSGTINIANGDSATVTGSSDTISAGTSATATVDGSSDTVLGSSDTITFGAGESGDKLTGNSDTVDLGNNSSVTVDGSSDPIHGGSSDTIDITGIDDPTTASNSTIDVTGSNTGDTVTGTGDTGSGYISSSPPPPPPPISPPPISPPPISPPPISPPPSDGYDADDDGFSFDYYGDGGADYLGGDDGGDGGGGDAYLTDEGVIYSDDFSHPITGATALSIVAYDLNSPGHTAAIQGQLAALSQALNAELNTNANAAQVSSFEGARWTSTRITWSLMPIPNSEVSGSDPNSQYVGVIQQAFDLWSAASGLTFEEVPDSPSSDIRITWSSLDTVSTGLLGYTASPHSGGEMLPSALIQLENPAQTPLSVDADGQLAYDGTNAELLQVVLHEIGHALGLADDSDIDSIMYPYSSASNRTLDATDIAGIQTLYGVNISPELATHSSEPGSDGTVLASLSHMNNHLTSNLAALTSFTSTATPSPPPHAPPDGTMFHLAADQQHHTTSH